ncbi:MAG: PspA/IM30 family protein [Symbiobacteriaceae bacterium]|nr:PspA/IM30 family protein [Symbiobacteriaceae bacterium]
MGLFQRLWMTIKGWFGMGISAIEDPNALLEAAQNELREKLKQVRQQAISVVQQKNQIEMMLQNETNKQNDLNAQIRQALRIGRDDLAEQLMKQLINVEATVSSLQAQYEQALQASETVKQQVKLFEEQVQAKYREKLQLQTQWKQAQITEKLNSALAGISIETSDEAWDRAREKIQERQARAGAIAEMGGVSANLEMQKLNSEMANAQAHDRLMALKREMESAEVRQGEVAAGTVTESQLQVEERLEKIKQEMGEKHE